MSVKYDLYVGKKKSVVCFRHIYPDRVRAWWCQMNYEKQQRTGQAPGGFTDASATGNSPRFRGLGRGVAELN